MVRAGVEIYPKFYPSIRWAMEMNPELYGELMLEEHQPNCVKVHFVPPKGSLIDAKIDPDKATEHRVQILLINGQNKRLTIYPINTRGNHPQFLKQKYDQIRSITLADTDIIYMDSYTDSEGIVPTTPEGVFEILENLPSTFVKNYAYGLGLAQDYRFIIDAVEELSECTKIVISRKHQTKISASGKVFYIAKKDFEEARLELNRIDNNTNTARRSVKIAMTHNILAERLGLPLLPIQTGRSPYRKFFTAMAQGQEPLTTDQQNGVLDTLSANKREIAEKLPEKFAKLRNDIELVTLEKLIERYEEMLGKNLQESKWQTFFNKNPFILNLAFGYPVVKIQDQVSVGVQKLSGQGEKIADFLLKNTLTNNAAIFEIKTPKTTLFKTTPYRGNDLYAPSTEFSGAINQALEQKYELQKNILYKTQNGGDHDIESYAVHCCLIIGTMPEGNDKKKSFELFRRNSKDVEIVTFDELLEKIKQLRDFLKSEETVSPLPDDRLLPF